jgi:hypothetical protein
MKDIIIIQAVPGRATFTPGRVVRVTGKFADILIASGRARLSTVAPEHMDASKYLNQEEKERQPENAKDRLEGFANN